MGLISLRADTGMAPTARGFRAEEGVLFLLFQTLSLRLYGRCVIFHRSDDSHFPGHSKKKRIAFVGAFQSLTLPMKKTVEISLLGVWFLLYSADSPLFIILT
jgi:hypothetical protein